MRWRVQLRDKALRPYYAALSQQVQCDLEEVAMDFVTGANATTMFTYQKDNKGAATAIPQHDVTVAIGESLITGITVFAHDQASYFELQLDGYSDQTAAAQAGAQLLGVLEGKTK